MTLKYEIHKFYQTGEKKKFFSLVCFFKNVVNKLSSSALLLLLTACSVNSCLDFKPEVCYIPNETLLHSLPSSFPPLTQEELETEWGKELFIGLRFAEELDFYRAISCFKRGLFIVPNEEAFRARQIEFCIFQAYYLAGKYADALLFFDNSQLKEIPLNFPAFEDLLLMLYECYLNTNQVDHALRILCLLDTRNSEKASDIKVHFLLNNADFPLMKEESKHNLALDDFLNCYSSFEKSPQKARLFNAILPGAGYYYVGQKKAAFSAIVINALFTAAAYQFFDRGYWAAGLITAGIEAGWYFGGINGAALAANEHNERIYECQAKDFMVRQKLFPILMFHYAF